LLEANISLEGGIAGATATSNNADSVKVHVPQQINKITINP